MHISFTRTYVCVCCLYLQACIHPSTVCVRSAMHMHTILHCRPDDLKHICSAVIPTNRSPVHRSIDNVVDAAAYENHAIIYRYPYRRARILEIHEFHEPSNV